MATGPTSLQRVPVYETRSLRTRYQLTKHHAKESFNTLFWLYLAETLHCFFQSRL